MRSMLMISAATFAVLLSHNAFAGSPQEPLSVEIDAFSGLPNPTFVLTEGDIALLAEKLAAYHNKATVSPNADAIIDRKTAYPDDLGYRRVRIYRIVDGSKRPVLVAERKSIIFVKGEAAFLGLVSNSDAKVQSEAADLLAPDSSSAVEKFLIDLAFTKGVISGVVKDMAIKAIDARH